MNTYNPYSLEGKTILVTGASSGIGRSTAIECAKMGAKVIITGRNSQRLNETLSLMVGENHEAILCDLIQQNDVNEFIGKLPLIDGLVNNAGISKLATVGHLKENEIHDILQTNTVAPILLLNGLVKKKKLQKGGSVVFTSSIAGVFRSSLANSMYSTSKAAIHGFVKNAALELASKKIRVNSVSPAMIETELIGKSGLITDEQYEQDKQTYPLKRYGKPEEVAHSIIFLLSDATTWITGTSIIIDGGITLR